VAARLVQGVQRFVWPPAANERRREGNRAFCGVRPVVSTHEASKSLSQLAKTRRVASLGDERLGRGHPLAQRRQFAWRRPGPWLARLVAVALFLNAEPVRGPLLGRPRESGQSATL